MQERGKLHNLLMFEVKIQSQLKTDIKNKS